MRPQSVNQFKLEALEPRLLLSADPGLVLGSVASPSGDNFEFMEQEVAYGQTEVLLSDNFENFSEQTGEVFDPLSGMVDGAEEIDATEDIQVESSESDPAASQAEEVSGSHSEDINFPEPDRELGELSRFEIVHSLKSKTDELVETLHAANGPPQYNYNSLSVNTLQILSSNSSSAEAYSLVHFSSASFLINHRLLASRHGVQTTGQPIRFDSEFLLTGSGKTRGTIENYGTLSPGNSPGVIDHTGDFIQAGVLAIEIGGLNSGPGNPTVDDGYDQLNISGELSLGGILEVSLINDFVPALGDTFEVLTYGSVVGEFDTLTGLDLRNGLYLKPVADDTSYSLSVVEGISVYLEDDRLFVNGGSEADDEITVSLDQSLSGYLMISTESEVFLGSSMLGAERGSNSVSVPLESIGSIEANGFGGDDTLTVDFSLGNPIPNGGLVYNGGEQQTVTGDQLVIEGGVFSSSLYEVSNETDGTIVLDGNRIRYTGLEPIVDNSSTIDRVFGLSANDDPDASLSSAGGGFVTLSGSTFEEVSFLLPSNSLTIQGLEGVDKVSIGSLDMGATALTIEAETIEIPAGATISGTGDVTLNGVSSDLQTVTTGANLISRSARVGVLGGIDTTGTVRLRAEVFRNVAVSGGSSTALTLEASSTALVEIGQNASLTGDAVSAVASTQGAVLVENAVGEATNKFADSASVIFDGAVVTANTLNISTLRATDYSAKGSSSQNQISGDTKATIGSSAVNVASGGASISADDTVKATAESAGIEVNLGSLLSNEIGLASARNWISGDTQALISDSEVNVTSDGSLELRGERHIQVKSTVASISLTGSLPAGGSITLDGLYVSNTLLGNVESIVEGGTVTTVGTGDIQINANERSAMDARSGITATGTDGLGGSISSIGSATAFNVVGWDSGDFLFFTLDALLGSGVGTETPAVTTAYVLDSAVTAGNDLMIGAKSETKLNATVSDASEVITSGSTTGAVLASNFVSSKARAFVDFSTTQGSVVAGGDMDVLAHDKSEVYSNGKLVSSTTVTNDGGKSILDEVINTNVLSDFFSGDGSTAVSHGQTVLLSDDYSNGGVAGSVYRHMGALKTLDLSVQDYGNLDFWKKVDSTTLIPAGIDFSGTRASSSGGIVIRNDVRSDVDSSIKNTEVQAGGLSVIGMENAVIHAVADSTADAAGVSAFGSGISIAINGAIATNLVLSRAIATVIASTLNVDQRAVQVRSQNNSAINADNQTVTSSEGFSAGVMLAFNTIGWKAQNVLYQAIDALVGNSLGDEQPASVTASIVDTTLNLGGDLSVTADSRALISAKVGNDSTSAASTLFLPISGSASAVMASNMVSSVSDAFIDYVGDPGTVNVGGALSVIATDMAGIESNTQMKAVSSATEGIGGSLIGSLIGALADEYEFTSKSGTRVVKNSERVRVASDHTAGGVVGATYLYVGANASWNLGTQDYTIKKRWKRVVGTGASEFLSSLGNITPSVSVALGGLVDRNEVRSTVTANIDNSNVNAGGALQVVADQSAVIRAKDKSISSSSSDNAFGTSVSLAVNGTIVTNLVLSTVDATITNSDVTVTGASDLAVRSTNDAKIDARVNSAMTSDMVAVGVTLAFNTVGWAAQNLLYATIDALIGSDYGTEQPAAVTAAIENTPLTVGGNLTVAADGSEQINATISNAADSVSSGLFGKAGGAASAVLASNMVSSNVDAHIDHPAGSQGTVQAGGNLLVSAKDDAGVYSNVKLVASSVTTSDGGVNLLTDALSSSGQFDFLSQDGLQEIQFGSKVRIAENYDNGGEPGSIYRYMGEDAAIDLSAADYSDVGFWFEESETVVDPPDVNLSSSSAMAIGGLVDRNDVRSQVQGLIRNSTVNAGAVQVDGLESATIKATADSTAESAGGSAFGGGVDLAVNATIAMNLILSKGTALIQDSTITTTANDVQVIGRNDSIINAKVLSSTTSGGAGVTLTLAFNTIGWRAQNILMQASDALLGDSFFGGEDTSFITSTIVDSPVKSAAGISVLAYSKATIRSSITNKTDSVAESLVSAFGLSLGFTLASNLVSSKATASVVSNGVEQSIDALGAGFTVVSEDKNSILANSEIVSIASAASSDVLGTGANLVSEAVQNSLGLDYTDRSGVRDLERGDVVLLDAPDFTSFDSPEIVVSGDRIKLEFTEGGGMAGDVYEYLGTASMEFPDFSEADYTDETLWKKISGNPGDLYTFKDADETGVNLASEDFDDSSRWDAVSNFDPADYLPSLGLTGSTAVAFGGLIVRNDVRSTVVAEVRDVNVNAAGDVTIQAYQTPKILARDSSVVEAEAGSVTGEGSGIAINAVIATNLVLNSVNASISNGSVTTSNSGNFNLESENRAKILADVTSSVSGDIAIGVVLAFNTVGWNSQNFLKNSADALFGTSLGSENTAKVFALATGTSIDASGSITVKASSKADIFAHVENAATAIGVGLGGE